MTQKNGRVTSKAGFVRGDIVINLSRFFPIRVTIELGSRRMEPEPEPEPEKPRARKEESPTARLKRMSKGDLRQFLVEVDRMADAKGYEEVGDSPTVVYGRKGPKYEAVFHLRGSGYDHGSYVVGTGKTINEAQLDAIKLIYRETWHGSGRPR